MSNGFTTFLQTPPIPPLSWLFFDINLAQAAPHFSTFEHINEWTVRKPNFFIVEILLGRPLLLKTMVLQGSYRNSLPMGSLALTPRSTNASGKPQ